LVDCTLNINAGCNGGWPHATFLYLVTRGVMSQANYPYTSGATGVNGDCKNTTKISYTVHDLVWCAGSDCGAESEKWFALLNKGALTVVIDVDGAFWNYQSGILNYNCSSSPNHGVIAVGWGVDRKAGKYIIARNSWSYQWGENGYFRFAYNMTNNSTCCMTNWAWQTS